MSDDHSGLVVYPKHFALRLATELPASVNSLYNFSTAIALIEDTFPFVHEASLSRLPLRHLERCLRTASAAGLLDETEGGYVLRHNHTEQLVLDLWRREQKREAGRASGRSRRERAKEKDQQLELLGELVTPAPSQANETRTEHEHPPPQERVFPGPHSQRTEGDPKRKRSLRDAKRKGHPPDRRHPTDAYIDAVDSWPAPEEHAA